MTIKHLAFAAGIAFVASLGTHTANAAPIAPAPIASPAAGLIDNVGYKSRRGYHQRNGIVYYNGYRGYRHHRVGHRHYRGHYFPRRAFTIRVYIGPNYQRRHVGPRIINVGTSHVRFCYSKYRSYRASDNTFQPYHGPRKRCRSPYAR